MRHLLCCLVLVAACADTDKSAPDATDTTDDGAEDTDTTPADDTEDTEDTEDTTKTEEPDETADTDEVDDTEPADTDAAPVDTEAPPAVPTSDLQGLFTAHAPYEACMAVLFNQTVVEIVAVDDNSISITDGTHTFACDVSGANVACAPLAGATTGIAIAPGVSCDWPYTVHLTGDALTGEGFYAAVEFTTEAGTGAAGCADALPACSGGTRAWLGRWAPSPGQDLPPAKVSIATPAGP